MGSRGSVDYEGRLMEDFDLKLKVSENDENDCSLEINNRVLVDKHEVSPGYTGEDDDDDEDFTFICTNSDGSSISADDVFQNGQIRPGFPLFNQNLLFSRDEDSQPENSATLRSPFRKIFVEERDNGESSSSESDEPEGPYCVWTGKAVDTSREVCKKSNSTGFSKLWRFRELSLRSNSDGKDAFVFLNNQHPPVPKTTAKKSGDTGKKAERSVNSSQNDFAERKRKVVASKVKKGGVAAASAAEKHYVENRKMKESYKRKSYLPYRQGIVGIFTNVNGMSRNVHPF
ncbi:hypothetical protein K2173_003269 [Erythroxylum novogranatense]|uniref:Uncharacterized protein n=1 Tax=Erythroxylum novogranatense TaxID=1862640 RepID=A0AAV8SY11_9ROSI|nr:hypothetical protein K2173_003269 [Erythroxylum novogranatense]